MLETTRHMTVSVTKTNGGNLEILSTHSPSCLCLQAFKMFLKILFWVAGGMVQWSIEYPDLTEDPS